MPINTKYDIKIEVITPISIGSGAESDYVKGADYVEKGGRVYLLNLHKMVDAGIDIGKLTAFFEHQDENGVLQILTNKLGDVSDKVYDATVSSDNPIKAMVKNELTDCPIIPGSSLKGALRSHIFKFLGGDKNSKDKELFGDMNKGENFMRFIKLSDFEFDDSVLVNTKIFNLKMNENGNWQGGWKHGAYQTNSSFKPTGFNTIYESLKPQSVSYGCIMLSEMMFDRVLSTKGNLNQRELLSLNNLFHIINGQTKEYLLKERQFFETYNQAEGVVDIIDSIDHLLSIIPDNDNACLLKMAAGSGFNAITGDWQFEDYTGGNLNRKKKDNPFAADAKPKSRKIAISGKRKELMGFVMLSLSGSEDAKQYYEHWKSNVASAKELYLEKAEIVNARKREIEEAKEKRERYNLLIASAEDALTSGEYIEAEKLLNQANELFNEGRHIQMLQEVERLKEKHAETLALELKIQADTEFELKHYQIALTLYEKMQNLCQTISVYEKIEICKNHIISTSETIDQFIDRLNIASLKAFAGKCKKRYESGNTFALSDAPLLINKIKSALPSLNKKDRGLWTDRNKWRNEKLFEYLGEEVANAILDEIVKS